MQFTLTMKLDNAEVEEMGADQAVPGYLETIGERVQDGHREGTVMDGNGNVIGQWAITGE